MDNLEYLKEIKQEDKEFDKGKRSREMSEIEFRKAKALEIIAEELIKHNDISCNLVVALENIDTTLNRS